MHVILKNCIEVATKCPKIVNYDFQLQYKNTEKIYCC